MACRGPAPPPPLPKLEGFELLSPGAEPRAELRYLLRSGVRSATALRLRAQPLGVPMRAPTLRFLTETELLGPAVQDAAPLRIRIVEAATEPPGAEGASEEALAALRGAELRASATPLGTLRDVTLQPPPGATPPSLAGLRQSMQQLILELPPPAVGVGARWTIDRPIEQPQIVFSSRTTYELVELSPTSAKIRSEITMTAPDQTIRQGELSASLTGLAGSGAGEVTVDLGALTLTGQVSSSYRGQLTGEEGTSELGMELSVSLGRP